MRIARSPDTPPARPQSGSTPLVVVVRLAIVVNKRQRRFTCGPHGRHGVGQAQVTQDAKDHDGVQNQRHQRQSTRAFGTRTIGNISGVSGLTDRRFSDPPARLPDTDPPARPPDSPVEDRLRQGPARCVSQPARGLPPPRQGASADKSAARGLGASRLVGRRPFGPSWGLALLVVRNWHFNANTR